MRFCQVSLLLITSQNSRYYTLTDGFFLLSATALPGDLYFFQYNRIVKNHQLMQICKQVLYSAICTDILSLSRKHLSSGSVCRVRSLLTALNSELVTYPAWLHVPRRIKWCGLNTNKANREHSIGQCCATRQAIKNWQHSMKGKQWTQAPVLCFVLKQTQIYCNTYRVEKELAFFLSDLLNETGWTANAYCR